MSGTLKNTKQREAIMRVLTDAKAPLSAEEVAQALTEGFPKLALSTVYRNLERFAQAGLVERSLFHDGITRYSLERGRHGHYLICTACHEKLRIGGCPMEHIERQLAQDTGYQISGHDLTIYGVCPKCKREQQK